MVYGAVLYRAYSTIVQSQNKNASEKQHIVLGLASAPNSTEYEKSIVQSQGQNMHKKENKKRSKKQQQQTATRKQAERAKQKQHQAVAREQQQTNTVVAICQSMFFNQFVELEQTKLTIITIVARCINDEMIISIDHFLFKELQSSDEAG